ncbi:unnamed protein product, partial [Pylaiella littoralis]
HKIHQTVLKISELETELGEIKDSLGGKADKAHPAAPGIARINHSILIGKDSTQVRSLVGVSSHYLSGEALRIFGCRGRRDTYGVLRQTGGQRIETNWRKGQP